MKNTSAKSLAPRSSLPEYKQRVRSHFNRASCTYDSACHLQQQIGEALYQHLPSFITSPSIVLDIGCGTGNLTQGLQQALTPTLLIGMDLAEASLKIAQQRTLASTTLIQGDFDSIPLANQSVDLLFSNMSLQWSDDLAGCFQEIHRVLKPKGLCAVTLPTSSSFSNLRSAIQDTNSPQFLNSFIDVDVLLATASHRFELLYQSTTTIPRHFPSLTDLLHSIKRIGGSCLIDTSIRALTRRDIRALEDYFGESDIPLEWSITSLIVRPRVAHDS